MSFSVVLQIKNPGRYAFNRERLFGVVETALRQQGDNRIAKGEKVVVSLLVVNKAAMAKYNWQYHQTKGPTDVLSFPYTDPQSQVSTTDFVVPQEAGQILGDLIVCYPIARETAVKEGKSTQDMLEFYVEHGLQHLLGHHHE